jgi:hypothetical protein
MNIINTASIRAAALAAALFVIPSIVSAKENAPADQAAQLLASVGIVPVKAVGPYIEIGSYRIWVSSHLGRPSAVLANGTWLYRGFTADESVASGTLVVRFSQGRVSQLSLVSPAVETAMLTAPASPRGQMIALK